MERELMNKKVLLIEDEEHILEGLILNLKLANYEVVAARDGKEGIEKWQSESPDLIVLDIMLPKIDGYTILKMIREKNEKIPILILSAKDTTEDKIKGLAGRADDYLPKPFNLDEFLLRVERLVTKSSWYEDNSKDEVYFGNNYVNFKTYKAKSTNREITLTVQEARLLKVLVEKKGNYLGRDELYKLAWGYSEEINSRTVDNFILRFRKYFEDNPKSPKFFISKRSKGYMFQSGGLS